jgi:hypothetical protein
VVGSVLSLQPLNFSIGFAKSKTVRNTDSEKVGAIHAGQTVLIPAFAVLTQLRGFALDFAEGEKIFPCRSMPGLWISAEIAL